MKVKTSELQGAALDWAVAKCEDRPPFGAMMLDRPQSYVFRPSTDWAQGGPIIEQNLLVLSPDPEHNWVARSYMDATEWYGTSPLIAAMRCYVASKLGEEVDIPDELIQERI